MGRARPEPVGRRGEVVQPVEPEKEAAMGAEKALAKEREWEEASGKEKARVLEQAWALARAPTSGPSMEVMSDEYKIKLE